MTSNHEVSNTAGMQSGNRWGLGKIRQVFMGVTGLKETQIWASWWGKGILLSHKIGHRSRRFAKVRHWSNLCKQSYKLLSGDWEDVVGITVWLLPKKNLTPVSTHSDPFTTWTWVRDSRVPLPVFSNLKLCISGCLLTLGWRIFRVGFSFCLYSVTGHQQTINKCFMNECVEQRYGLGA